MEKKIWNYEITELPKDEWKGTRIYLDYVSEEYYDVELTEDDNGFKAEMRKKRFETPFVHEEHGDFPDILFPDYWEGAQVFGIVSEENGKKEILACIEICPEEWSNRMMVTEMWVSKKASQTGYRNGTHEHCQGESEGAGQAGSHFGNTVLQCRSDRILPQSGI